MFVWLKVLVVNYLQVHDLVLSITHGATNISMNYSQLLAITYWYCVHVTIPLLHIQRCSLQQHYTIVCTYPTTPQPCARAASMSEPVNIWSPLIYVSAAEGMHLGSLSDFTRHLPQQKRNDMSCWTTAVPSILNQRTSLSATSNTQQTSFPNKWCFL